MLYILDFFGPADLKLVFGAGAAAFVVLAPRLRWAVLPLALLAAFWWWTGERIEALQAAFASDPEATVLPQRAEQLIDARPWLGYGALSGLALFALLRAAGARYLVHLLLALPIASAALFDPAMRAPAILAHLPVPEECRRAMSVVSIGEARLALPAAAVAMANVRDEDGRFSSEWPGVRRDMRRVCSWTGPEAQPLLRLLIATGTWRTPGSEKPDRLEPTLGAATWPGRKAAREDLCAAAPTERWRDLACGASPRLPRGGRIESIDLWQRSDLCEDHPSEGNPICETALPLFDRSTLVAGEAKRPVPYDERRAGDVTLLVQAADEPVRSLGSHLLLPGPASQHWPFTDVHERTAPVICYPVPTAKTPRHACHVRYEREPDALAFLQVELNPPDGDDEAFVDAALDALTFADAMVDEVTQTR